ncbi:polysaccharide biosynthesis tyrosine autokinase [Novipirellula artificiosorum]|uniref:non-specific protein-tyrosine kinase n=1 Tax=Novipirellula artificiosorum TaxID=2528016 RepID=A0A5C6DSL6_9BACT|nr:polysaccharide biosynthesis tyrosine autokinase [Novipirellula artificiosorum]TWU39204.1 Tyrosine-protein kinase YwqD [Novipirellula artificiosorum]
MRPQSSEQAVGNQSIELDFIGLFRRRWHHLLIGICVGIAIGLLYFYSTTPMYESRIEILVGQRSSEMANSGTMSNAQASGDTIHEDLLATHMRLFLSRKNIANAIETANLKKIASIGTVLADGGSPIDYIVEQMEVGRGGEGSAENAMVLSATYRDPNPDDAATILAAVFASYEDYVESHSKNTSREAANLIEKAQNDNKKELELADIEYREFIKNVPVLLEGDQVRDLHKNRLDQLEKELAEVRSSLAEAKSRLIVISSYADQSKESGVDDLDKLALLSQKEVTRLKLFLDMTRGETQSVAFQADQPLRAEAARAQYNRLLDLLQKERTMVDVYGANHPLVESTRQEIQVIKQFIEQNAPAETQANENKLDPKGMLSTYTRLLTNDVAEYEIREKVLVETSDQELIEAKKVENAFLEGSAKKAILVRAQARYDEVIRRLQELNLAGSYAGFSTDLLASPEAATVPSWPSLPIAIVVGAMLGLFLGSASALTSEILDTTFRDVEDLERALNAPAIAHVPKFDFRKLPMPAPGETPLAPSLVTEHCPRSAEAEVYRVARTSLMIKSRGQGTQVLMMSSPHPGDGKSTTIANLAISFAQTGKRVLLIDSDLRRPVVAGLFGLEGQPGLADVLNGQCSLAQSVTHSSVENLDIMPHGTETSVPAELLQSNKMSLLIQAARKEYDIVLIDAPPVLAVADPAIVAPLVDGVILTVRVCKNGRRAVERAGRILREINIQPLAIVVNGVSNNAKATYGYGDYRQEEYGYIGQYHRQYAAQELPVSEIIPKQKLTHRVNAPV